MSVRILAQQQRLKAAGYDPGPLDGEQGPQTFSALLSYTMGRDLGALGKLKGRAFAANFPVYDITTPFRIAGYIGQTGCETEKYRTFVEKGNGDGPDADKWDDYLERYDFRADLGNSHGGDGELYRGRGDIMITGHDNYQRYGDRIGVDLVSYPERAAEPEIGVKLAMLYWSDHRCNKLADLGDQGYRALTKSINGGYNGLELRIALTVRCLTVQL